jgi:phosphatidylserine decarboxylase
MWILYLLPKNYLSYLIGKLAAVELPKPLSTWLVKAFANFFKIDYTTASKEITEYKSISDFFIRDLKSYPVLNGQGVVTPAESTLRSFGKIRDGKILQVKDKNYSFKALLGDTHLAETFNSGTFFNFYLSPKDYHQVHSPVSGRIIASTYIKGKLWPVNEWSLNNIKNLFCVNERLITYIESEMGKVAVVMVGATNVGKITLSYDNWLTNNLFQKPPYPDISIREYQPQIPISQGQKLGVFHMGSAVVLLIDREYSVNIQKALPAHYFLSTQLAMSI